MGTFLGFGTAFGHMDYAEKLPHYGAQNLLARSLSAECYENNPGFQAFVGRSGLPFRPYEDFDADALIERGELYRQLAETVWNRDQLMELSRAAL